MAPRELLRELVAADASAASVNPAVLSARQREVLELAVEGLSNAEVARRLFVSESTVKKHLRAAYKALGVNNRLQAAKKLFDDTR